MSTLQYERILSGQLELMMSTSLLFKGNSEELPNNYNNKKKITESFVLSMDTNKAHNFKQRNDNSALGDVLWVPGVDGYVQGNLDQFAKVSDGWPAVNAALFDRHNQKDKDAYRSPHAVGCYLAHWHLLRQLNHRLMELRPDLYFVFEDDADCVTDLVNRTLASTSQLPSDWDIFYLGGKPITYFKDVYVNYTKPSPSPAGPQPDWCRGDLGRGRGPLAPDGSRALTDHQPYWKVKYLSNTHSYVVNPQRIDHLLQIIKPARLYEPLDIVLADAMDDGKLQAYMAPQKWCSAEPNANDQSRVTDPVPWDGFFAYTYYTTPAQTKNRVYISYRWQKMAQSNCSY
jgi:GR25 family glycosyltransferase involved in LPS biosynthesis